MIGAATSTPSESPTHHVSQLKPRWAAGTTPAKPRAAVPMLALTMQAMKAPRPKNTATSRGSLSTRGCDTARRTRRVPTTACRVAPAAIASGKARRTSSGRLSAARRAFSTKEPSATPQVARPPHTSTPARATPAAGKIGVA
jgi:hypothetical protein